MRNAAVNFFAALCAILVLSSTTACRHSETVTPRIVTDSAPSWDGNEQNSGFIGFDAQGNGIVTPRARARYNAMIERYGSRFAPSIGADYGVTATGTNAFLMTKEALVKFGVMNQWRKAGQ